MHRSRSGIEVDSYATIGNNFETGDIRFVFESLGLEPPQEYSQAEPRNWSQVAIDDYNRDKQRAFFEPFYNYTDL